MSGGPDLSGPSKNDKAALAGDGLLDGITNTAQRLSVSAESVKQEADKYFMLWLTGHGEYYRRLARTAADAARKGLP